MTVRLVISVTVPDDSTRFDSSDALTEVERAELVALGRLDDFLAQFTPEVVARDFLDYAKGWFIPREAGEAVYRVEAVVQTRELPEDPEDIPSCEGEHDPPRVAAFRFWMLDTTSLDGVADLCTECAWDHVKEWMKDPADAAGWEVRVLPIPPHQAPMMIQGGPQ